jgi:lysophospholipid acyltransferase
MRRLVRPYFLPASSPGAANSLPRWPYPNLAKRVYDVVGWAVVQTGVNYAVSPFFILDWWPSIYVMARGYFYGHVSIFLAIAFLQLGGRRALRRGLKPRVPKAPVEVPSFTLSPPSPEEVVTGAEAEVEAEVSEEAEANDTDLEWIPHDLNSSTEEGIEVGGMVEDILSGLDTPRAGTPVDAAVKAKAE